MRLTSQDDRVAKLIEGSGHRRVSNVQRQRFCSIGERHDLKNVQHGERRKADGVTALEEENEGNQAYADALHTGRGVSSSKIGDEYEAYQHARDGG